MLESNPTVPSDQTRRAEESDAVASHASHYDLGDDSAEEVEVEESSPEVARHYREMTDKGAKVRGEGETP